MDYFDVEWFALEMNQDYSVLFDAALEYCISDFFFDSEGHSVSSKGFLPAADPLHASQLCHGKGACITQ